MFFVFFMYVLPRLCHRRNKTLVKFAKQRRNPCSRPPSVYLDLSTCNDWPVKKAIVDLPIRLKGNSKRTSGFSLRAQNKDQRALLRRRY